MYGTEIYFAPLYKLPTRFPSQLGNTRENLKVGFERLYFRFAMISHRSIHSCHNMPCQRPFVQNPPCPAIQCPSIVVKLHIIIPSCGSLSLGVFLGGLLDGKGWNQFVSKRKDHNGVPMISQVPQKMVLPAHRHKLVVETYWVAAIASTSRPSLHPSRRACTGAFGSGP
jgi:hypothetical protein